MGQLCTKGMQELWGFINCRMIYTQMADMIKTRIAECCFVLIPILQKAKEGSGYGQRMTESLATLRAEP